MINLWQFSRAESQNEICAKWLPTEAKKTWLILSGTQICNNQIRKTSNKQRETTQREREREHCARGMQRTETKTWKNIRRKQQAATTTSTEATKRRIIYHNEDVRQRPRQHLQKAQIQRYKDTKLQIQEKNPEKRGEEQRREEKKTRGRQQERQSFGRKLKNMLNVDMW